MNGLLTSEWLTALTELVWRNSLQASVLTVAIVAVRTVAGRRISARWQYGLGLLVLVRLVLPLELPSRWSVFNLVPTKTAVPSIAATSSSLPAAETPTIVLAELTTTTSAIVPTRLDWPGLLRLVWVGGVLVTFGIVVIRQWRFAVAAKRLREVTEPRLLALLDECRSVMGLRCPIRLCEEARAVPALFGLRRHWIRLPADAWVHWRESEIRAVFMHELAHLKQHDLLVNWFMMAVRALHWFNPLVWFALRQCRADRELVRDQMVLQQLAAAERPRYGHTLLSLQAVCVPVSEPASLVPILNHKSEIQRRITLIAQFKPETRFASLAFAALIAPLALFTLTGAADVATPPQPATKAEPAQGSSEVAPPTQGTASGENLRNRVSDLMITELERELADQKAKSNQSQTRLLEIQRLRAATQQTEQSAKDEVDRNLKLQRALEVRLRQERVDRSVSMDPQPNRPVAPLEAENDGLSKQLNDLSTRLQGSDERLTEIRVQLAALGGDKEVLQKELVGREKEKSDLERQFHDLALLREQVNKLKQELAVARRLERIKQELLNSSTNGASQPTTDQKLRQQLRESSIETMSISLP